MLADVPTTAPAYSEEVFGPVAPVVRFDSVEEVVRLAADTPYGLSLGILTRDVMRGLEIAERIPSGLVHINDQTVNDEANIPFGGVRTRAPGRDRAVGRRTSTRSPTRSGSPSGGRCRSTRCDVSAPHLLRRLHDQPELGDLLLVGDDIALDRRGEAALG